MDSRRSEVSFPGIRSKQGRPVGPPFFFGAARAPRPGRGAAPARLLCAIAGAGLLGGTQLPIAAGAHDRTPGDPAAAPASASAVATIVLAAAGKARALECTSGREIAAFALPHGTAQAIVAPAPDGDAAFVAQGRTLLRLSVPALEAQARSALAFDAKRLAASGGRDATVLAAGAESEVALSAHEAASLVVAYGYRLDDGRRPTASAIVDRPQRSRFVVAFSDLDEVWEIDYGREAAPVLRGLVHDYRMREAIELPGRYTPRSFEVPGATRALVAGALPHEVLRVDASGALGVLNLDVRREIERPAVGAPPAPERIAAWRGTRSRGWVLADEGASTLRTLEAGTWKLVEPLPVGGELLAIAALDDGAVLAALAGPGALSLVRVDVEERRSREVATAASGGEKPYRFVRGTQDCFALVDAAGRWIAGAGAELRRGMRAAARGRGS